MANGDNSCSYNVRWGVLSLVHLPVYRLYKYILGPVHACEYGCCDCRGICSLLQLFMQMNMAIEGLRTSLRVV